MKSDKTLEELDVILVELVHHIGKQVTDDYEMKNGLYEGMSIDNVLSKDKARAALHRLILKERRKQTRKILRHEIDVWGSSRDESYLKSEVADLSAEIEGSNHE